MKNYPIEQVLKNIPKTNPDNTYWLVRAESGTYFEDFYINNYIAIGWNEISMKEVHDFSYNSDLIRSKLMSIHHLTDNRSNKQSMGSAAKQMIRFQEELRPGHVVLVPSESSDSFAVGEIVGEVYTETDEDLLGIPHTPYSKRRKIRWIGRFPRSRFDPAFHKVIYAAHAISNVSDYRGFINRAVFDTYIEDNDMHMTFNLKRTEGVELSELVNLLSSYEKIKDAYYPDEKIDIKINLQSPGPIEFIGPAMIVASITGFIFYNFGVPSVVSTPLVRIGKRLRYGGKLSVGPGGVSTELPNIKQTQLDEDRLEMEKEAHKEKMQDSRVNRTILVTQHQLEVIEKKVDLLDKLETDDNKEEIKAAKNGFISQLISLDGGIPEEYKNAVDKVESLDNKNQKGEDHPDNQ